MIPSERRKLAIAAQAARQVKPTAAAGKPLAAETGAQLQAASQPPALSAYPELDADLQRLKSYQGDEARNPIRAELINKWSKQAADYLRNSPSLEHCDLVFWWVVWHFDSGKTDRAVELSLQAIDKGLTCPQRFNRSFVTFYCDSLLAAAKPLGENSGIPAWLADAIGKTDSEQWSLPPVVRAKLHKRAGELTTDDAEKLDHYQSAGALDNKIGLKKKIEELQTSLSALGDSGADSAS